MNIVYLLLGGNRGNVKEAINTAKTLIAELIGSIISESSFYESEPWGFSSSNNFINQVLKIQTDLKAEQVLLQTQDIEVRLGRIRNNTHYESRTMDIDILFFNYKIIETEMLQIPHPRLHLRKFTLEPLNEIAGNFVHPILNETIENLNKKCDDKLWTKRI